MNGEILRLVDTLHRDKDIDKEIIFEGVEACILSAVRKKLGESEEFRVAIDRESGETEVFEGEEKIPISDLGRLAALQGKQVLFQKIREAERDRIYDEYEQKVGNLAVLDLLVIPVKTGIQLLPCIRAAGAVVWTPVFIGVTE